MAERYDFYVHDNRKVTFNLTEPIMREDSGVTDFVFHIPKILNELEVSDWSWWFVFVNAKEEKYSIALTLSDDPESPLEKNVATYTVDYAMSIKAGSVQFALEAINAGTGGAIDNEWHTYTYETKVKETLQGNQVEYAETESDIISALLIEVRNKINQVIGGATPTPVASVSAMTDPSKLYLLTTDGEWYYHNGTTFVSGGVYGAGVTDAVPTHGSNNAVRSGGVYSALDTLQAQIPQIDSTLFQSGQAADAKATGDEIKGFSANLRVLDTAYNTPLSGIYWGTIGSGTVAQVRTATSAYDGILFPIPIGAKSIDFSDMTPYSIRLFDHRPVLGETVATGKTLSNNILYLDAQNTYTWGLVTLKLSVDGNSKESFVIRMHGSAGDRISNLEKQNCSVVNGKSIPIVCLIYDDNTDGDDTLHSLLEERGLKGTFSSIGNVDSSDETWKAKAQKLQNWVAEGHGVLGHGLTSGVNVKILDGGSLAGISNISDADARKAVLANNKALDDYGLPHNGIAYWNVWEDTPHTRNIVEKYYNYGFTFGGADAGINTILTDKFALTRWTTDLSSHMTTALNILKSAIGQKCIVCFGGHMSRTASGEGSYSTLSEFTSFLNQIKEYVDLGLMVSLNTDDAIKLFYESGNLKGSYPYLPAVGDMVFDGGIKTCISAGSAYLCRITFTGTPADGHITIPELDIDVNTYSSDSITNVVERIVNSACNKRYTYQKTSATQVWCYANIAKTASTPTATVNTSGLTIAFSEKNAGADPVWV